MIFQEPMSSLNPCFTVGWQIKEALRFHLGLGRARAARPRDRTLRAGRHPRPRESPLGLPAPAFGRHEPARDDRHGDRLPAEAADRGRADDGARRDHPGADPRPAGRPAAKETGMGLVLITHDMGVVAETARTGERAICRPEGRGAAGRADSSTAPHHPYTAALLDALPERATERRLPTIPGVVPGQFDRPKGCLFSPRCKFADARCRAEPPPPLGPDLGYARCFYPLQHRPRGSPRDDAPVMTGPRRCERHYEVRGGFLRQSRTLRALGGLDFDALCRQDARRRGRKRLRQVHARPRRHDDRGADGGPADARRQGCPAGGLGELARLGADRLPGPLRLAQPAPTDRRRS